MFSYKKYRENYTTGRYISHVCVFTSHKKANWKNKQKILWGEMLCILPGSKPIIPTRNGGEENEDVFYLEHFDFGVGF